MIKLSILICSTHTRSITFLPRIMKRIFALHAALPQEQQDEVEILVLTDNKKIMLGDKRNKMVDAAQGEYVVFVDDDDRLEDDYISALLHGCNQCTDVVVFQASVSLNVEEPKICYYSKDYDNDHNTPESYHRLPNHICCIRRELCLQVTYPSIKYGEDSMFAKLIKPLLKTQYRINKVLYHYDFNENTTETQEHLVTQIKTSRTRPIQKPIADVVILANAKTEALRRMTQTTIDTCIAGANGLPLNIVVVEQTEGVKYRGAKTVYRTEPFNYNERCNTGAAFGKTENIVFANNDLIFENGWLHQLLTSGAEVCSPKCPVDARQAHIKESTSGYENGVHFSGWCFMMKRAVWKKIGGLDEDFWGWFADDAVIEQVKAVGIEPVLVAGALVRHLGSSTIHTLSAAEQQDLAWDKLEHFNAKYGKNKFVDNPNYLKWKKSVSE